MLHSPVTFSKKVSWPLPLILVSHLRLDCRSVVLFCQGILPCQGIIHRNIQSAKEVSINNNIQTVIFTNNT